jgi:hypothetical protein
MPNTYYMQELTRMHYDYYLDAVEGGMLPADPHYLCLPKGEKTRFPVTSQILIGT